MLDRTLLNEYPKIGFRINALSLRIEYHYNQYLHTYVHRFARTRIDGAFLFE